MYLKPLNCTPEMVTVVNFLLGIFYLRLKEESHDKPRQCFKKQRHHFANKGLSSQAMVFPVVVYGCESWTIRRLSTEELMILNCSTGEDF